VLDDPEWLAKGYEQNSAAAIARNLDINPQMVVAALKRHGIALRTRHEEWRRHNPELYDRDALERRIDQTSVDEVAQRLGVSKVAVHAALNRLGGHSSHRFDGKRPMSPPDSSTLDRWWAWDGTVRGVARRAGVSVNTAAIWLAQVGIFVNDDSVIARKDLVDAIEAGDSIETIRRRHKVTSRTVVVELHRHALFNDHRRRHMRRL
jgi:hypothetical protein